MTTTDTTKTADATADRVVVPSIEGRAVPVAPGKLPSAEAYNEALEKIIQLQTLVRVTRQPADGD
jgi:hypothetical protein